MNLFDAMFNNGLSDINIEQPIASPRPNLPQGPFSIGGITATVHGTVPSGTIAPPGDIGTSNPSGDASPQGTGATSSIFTQGVHAINDAVDKINAFGNETLGGNKAAKMASSGPVSLILSDRIVSGIVGLICIAAGLFMFQQTRELVVTGAKTAAKIAA